LSRMGRSSYAKRWDLVFATDRVFQEDFGQSFVQHKRNLGAVGDDVELFFGGSEDTISDCMIEELQEFCGGFSLQALRSGAYNSGIQRSAWLDERSSWDGSTRGHKNPLTATQLYQRLQIPVRAEKFLQSSETVKLILL